MSANAAPPVDPARSLECFGTTDMDAFVQEVEASVTFQTGGPFLCVTSLLSDAQEELDAGQKNAARQTINRAKFLLARYFAH